MYRLLYSNHLLGHDYVSLLHLPGFHHCVEKTDEYTKGTCIKMIRCIFLSRSRMQNVSIMGGPFDIRGGGYSFLEKKYSGP